jgi:hypothetical protein
VALAGWSISVVAGEAEAVPEKMNTTTIIKSKENIFVFIFFYIYLI